MFALIRHHSGSVAVRLVIAEMVLTAKISTSVLSQKTPPTDITAMKTPPVIITLEALNVNVIMVGKVMAKRVEISTNVMI